MVGRYSETEEHTLVQSWVEQSSPKRDQIQQKDEQNMEENSYPFFLGGWVFESF